MFLKRLTFVSTLRASLSFEGRVELMHAIMKKSSQQSKGALVTGVLVSVDKYFIEVLESSTLKISALLKQIMNNPAHANLAIIDIRSIDCRSFKEFPKEGCFVIESNSKFIREFTVHEKFNPYELDVDSLTKLTLEVPNLYKNINLD